MGRKNIESVTDVQRSTANVQKGSNTYNGGSLRGVSDATKQNLANYEKGYTPGEGVAKAQQNLADVQAGKPGPFSSGFEAELDSLYKQIKDRKPFTYNMDADALYQQYAEQYKRQGKQAMKDTIGQASAMTGGYGNSYAETAGYQAYSQYLDQLNDRAMDFYQLAQNRYDKEGDRLNDLYGMAKGRYDTDYAQYRDRVSDYYQDYNNAYNAFQDERGFDYQKFSDMLSYWQQQAQAENSDYWSQTNFDESVRQYDEDMAYKKGRDAVADSQWAREMAYKKERDAVADSQWAKEFEESKANSAYNRSLAGAKAAAEAADETYKDLVKAGKQIFNKGEKGAQPFLTWIDNMLNGGLVDNETAAMVIDEVMKNYKYGYEAEEGTDAMLDYLKKSMAAFVDADIRVK